MNRSASLKRTPGPKRRKGVNRVSARTKAQRGEKSVIREAVFERDRGCVLARIKADHRCIGGRTAHHLRKASAGGSYSLDNLVELCAYGNGWVEDNPAEATALGLVRR